MPDTPKGFSILELDKTLSKKELEKIRDNFSAGVLHDNHLWLGGDEGTSIDRMTRDAHGNYRSHVRFDLAPVLKLSNDGGEIDIEGLDADGGYLWLIGCHSLKRNKAEPDKRPVENMKRLANVTADDNRFTLARVPLDASGKPVETHGNLTAARLHADAHSDLLTEALREDKHLGAFIPCVLTDGTIEGIPSKDNGLDIEGLAVSHDRVFFGLRGPVLRGWSVLIEVRVTDASAGVLMLDALGASSVRFRRHFLQLEGLGVRDLVLHGKDLFVLAGPTMNLDGPVFIYRWSDALERQAVLSDVPKGWRKQRVANGRSNKGVLRAFGPKLLPMSPE